MWLTSTPSTHPEGACSGVKTPRGVLCCGCVLCWQLVYGRRHVDILSLEAVGSYALR